jgi:hypothetical protein
MIGLFVLLNHPRKPIEWQRNFFAFLSDLRSDEFLADIFLHLVSDERQGQEVLYSINALYIANLFKTLSGFEKYIIN